MGLVSIPSDRGIRSGAETVALKVKPLTSQSPLIGAFVPGNLYFEPVTEYR